MASSPSKPRDFAIEPEDRPSAWWIAAPLIIWSMHFLIVYIWTALVCVGRVQMTDEALGIAIAIVTAGAAIPLLVLIIWPIMKLVHRTTLSRSLFSAIGMSSFISLIALGLVAGPAFVLDACA